MSEAITRGLVTYDCLGLADCAALGGANCPCARRWAGETVPFPQTDRRQRETRRQSLERVVASNPPAPTLGDVLGPKLRAATL